jgi:hypothetical protein
MDIKKRLSIFLMRKLGLINLYNPSLRISIKSKFCG